MSLRARNRQVIFVLLVVCAPAQLTVAQNSSDTTSTEAASFDELRSRLAVAQSTGASNEATSKRIEAWVDQAGIDHLSIDQAQWCLEQSLPNATERKAFSVTWTGLVTPPRTGKYTFSVSPINVNQPFGPNTVRHSLAVTVADQRVIDIGSKSAEQPGARRSLPRQSVEKTAASEWQWKGEPIELQAGQPAPIRVEMHYECREPSTADSPSAILNWEGPGISRQTVPSGVLTLANGSTKGLRAEYTLHEGRGLPRTVIQTNSNVDFAWTMPADVAPASPGLVAQLTNRLWQLATTPEFLAECAAGGRIHPYFASGRSTQYLTSAQRREFLQLLVNNGPLLGHVEDDQLLQLYRAFRFGAEDDAVDLLGTWMQLNADIAPKITADFFRDNRQVYAELAIHLSGQQHDAYRLLQDRYLEMPDGRCAVPVAYTLSYSYRASPPSLPSLEVKAPPKSPMTEWFELMDAKIDDQSLSGNGRVNWLIAKAQSLEPRGFLLTGPSRPQENYLAGLDSLTEAHLVADDDATRARVYAEEVARLAIANRKSQLNELLQAASSTVPAQVIKDWRQAVAAIADNWQQRRVADSKLARAAYIRAIRNHREQAIKRNDEQAVQRYDQILQKSTADAK